MAIVQKHANVRKADPAGGDTLHDRQRGPSRCGTAAGPRMNLESSRRPVLELGETSIRAGLNPAQAPHPEAYTVTGALAATGIGKTKLYEELNAGRLKSFLLCGRRLILRDDLIAWLRAAREAA